jgi:hypothetical protein
MSKLNPNSKPYFLALIIGALAEAIPKHEGKHRRKKKA